MSESWKITLASQSPRRKELLSGLGIQFSVESCKGNDESFEEGTPHELIPELLAKRKSLSLGRDLEEKEILVTADTLVFLDDEVLGKPKDRDDAFRILRMLSGRTHKVITGVALRTRSAMVSFSDTTEVTFADLTDAVIACYIDNFKPFDKAGAYGIQEWIGYAAIDSIRGSYHNVMGLPTHRVFEALRSLTGDYFLPEGQ